MPLFYCISFYQFIFYFNSIINSTKRTSKITISRLKKVVLVGFIASDKKTERTKKTQHLTKSSFLRTTEIPTTGFIVSGTRDNKFLLRFGG